VACSALAKHQRGNILRVTLPIFRKTILKEIFQKWVVSYERYQKAYYKGAFDPFLILFPYTI
jgi:hypothetical protein